MKFRKSQGGGGGNSSGEESSDDERIFQPEEFLEGDNNGDAVDDDFLESSQQDIDLTQPVPRSSDSKSPKKKKKKDKEKTRVSEESADVSNHITSSCVSNRRNGFRIREVDESEIPEHLIKNTKRVFPTNSDCVEGLAPEDIEAATSSSKGGIWLLQCPKNVRLSELLLDKEISLNGKRSVFSTSEDDVNLTQFAPTDSLGRHVENRRFESIPTSNEDYKQGTMLLLPDANNSFKLVAAPINGHIIIREAVQELLIPKVEIPDPKPRHLPAGIKERHPVYGADFSNIIREMEASSGHSPRKKKKKSHTRDQEVQEHQWTPITQNGFLDEVEIKQEPVDEEYHVHTKHKKKKKKSHHEDKSYDDDVQNEIAPVENASIENDDEVHEKRKKKSKKRKHEEIDESVDNLYNNMNGTDMVKKSKKSKHRE